MIRLNHQEIKQETFPDNTLLMKLTAGLPEFNFSVTAEKLREQIITWNYEKNAELFSVYCLTRKLQECGFKNIILEMPYIPNARQDRGKKTEDILTLKYFAEIINRLNFYAVKVLDPHSIAAENLINNLWIQKPIKYIHEAIEKTGLSFDKNHNNVICYPDSGSVKRLSEDIKAPYVYGDKKRDWETGDLHGTTILGNIPKEPFNVFFVDDICAYGGTAYYTLLALKELGAKDIYLFFTHCENSILEGKQLIGSGLFKKIYTTDSIFTGQHDLIEVIKLEKKKESE